MPLDCEINWKKHPPSIKGPHNFGMVLDSSSEHHPDNMKLLLITIVVACLATGLATPSEKTSKRGVLPGDPRYGTEYHRQQIELQPAYGPPHLHPGHPYGDYIPPLTDISKYSTPVSIYGAPDSFHIPKVTKIAGISEFGPAIHSTTIAPLVEKVKTVTFAPPITSYGTPAVDHYPIPLPLNGAAHLQSIHRTVKTELLDVPKPAVKVFEPPLIQGVPQYAGLRTAAPLLTGYPAQKSFIGSGIVAKGIPDAHSAGLISAYSVPSALHTKIQPAIDTGIYNGYYRTAPLQPAISLAPAVKAIPQIHALPTPATTYDIAKTAFEFPHSFTHAVKQIEPLHAAHAINAYGPLTSVKTIETLPPIHAVKTVKALPALHSVRTYDPLPAVRTVPALHSAAAVKTLTPLYDVPSIKSYTHLSPAHAFKTIDTYRNIHPLTSVKSFETVTPVHTVESVTPLVPTIHSVSQLPPLDTLKTFRTELPKTTLINHHLRAQPAINVHLSAADDSLAIGSHGLLNGHGISLAHSKGYIQSSDANGGYIY